MLSDKQNTYRWLHTNTTDTAVSEKHTIYYTTPTKPTKTTDSWNNTDISNNKTDHPSQDENLLFLNFITPVKNKAKTNKRKSNQKRFVIKQKN